MNCPPDINPGSVSTPIISLSDVSLTREERTILSDIDLTVGRGDFLAITGPNGGGKTTLLRIMLKLQRPTSGQVTYYNMQGEPVRHLSIGYLPQKNSIDSSFPISVSEVVGQGLLNQPSLSGASRRARVADMLGTLGLTDYADQSIGRLSGGQQQRALLGRALVSRPELLVLDEPLSYLDKHHEQLVYQLLKHLSADTTIIMVSHEVSTLAGMASRHIIVDHTIEICHSKSHFVHYDCG